MRELAKADYPIVREEMARERGRSGTTEERGEPFKVEILRRRCRPT